MTQTEYRFDTEGYDRNGLDVYGNSKFCYNKDGTDNRGFNHIEYAKRQEESDRERRAERRDRYIDHYGNDDNYEEGCDYIFG